MTPEVQLFLIKHGPPEVTEELAPSEDTLEQEINQLATEAKSLELRLSERNSLLITGGQDGQYMVGVDQPSGWRNALPADPQDGMVELTAGGQKAFYPRSACLAEEATQAVALDFLQSHRLSAACRWDNPPTHPEAPPESDPEDLVEEEPELVGAWYGSGPAIHWAEEPRFSNFSGSFDDAIEEEDFREVDAVKKYLHAFLAGNGGGRDGS